MDKDKEVESHGDRPHVGSVIVMHHHNDGYSAWIKTFSGAPPDEESVVAWLTEEGEWDEDSEPDGEYVDLFPAQPPLFGLSDHEIDVSISRPIVGEILRRMRSLDEHEIRATMWNDLDLPPLQSETVAAEVEGDLCKLVTLWVRRTLAKEYECQGLENIEGTE